MKKETAFNLLTLKQKYAMLQSKGEFVTSRYHGSYHIHLFIIDENYVEVWKSAGLSYIHWIEIVKSQKILENYIDDIDLKLP